ncbi:gamma-glutamyltransferase [Georgenia sp. 10Sc9-8]|uniref:Gamma-glutamyltransferase n=1 Tax=Georgenia halotolerans TaxID=3028317 RepID=A0ABT5TX68_9MICO|nr:gamma-glutamyltransferase [Georgenia halotolerans]
MRRRTAGLAVLLTGAVVTGCTNGTEPDAPEETTTAAATNAPTTVPAPDPTAESTALAAMGVSAGHPAAVEAGTTVLQGGGNAVDAAIATAFAVAVVEPYASGIGGGGAALVVPTDAAPAAYDYREVVAEGGVIPPSSIGIPGFVAGMAELHSDHADLPWAEVLEPAIELAREGHPASEMLVVRLREDRGPGIAAEHPQFAADGRPLAAGDVLVQEELAATMQTLAEEGAASFYEGSIAEDLVSVEGIDRASLTGYEVQRNEPVRGEVGEHEVLAAAPPLPGVALVQMLQVAEALGVAGTEPGSAEYVHQMSSAWQVADDTVSTELGDPDFVDVPVDELTDAARNADLAAAVTPSGPVAGAPRPGNTTHVSVVDAEGLTVSMTNTIMHWWGSGTYHQGFFLNDQLTRFEALDTPQNQPAPGRRSVSWSLPAVVVDGQDRPVLVIGSPGGRLIPNILAGVIARWSLLDQPLPEAVAAPRFHLEGSTLQVEESLPSDTAEELRDLGYQIEEVPPEVYLFGSVQALAVDHGTGAVAGATDDRRQGGFAVVQVVD